MQMNRSIWETAELLVNGSLSEEEKVALQQKISSDQAYAEEFNECVNMLKVMSQSGKQKQFRKMAASIHKEHSQSTSKKIFNRVIKLPAGAWRTAAVAACVALITSSLTYWSLTPSLKKNDSQYNTISREVEHIKNGLKNNTDDIETIKKSTVVSPRPSANAVKITGTGFAITNDGYFVTASHVVNHGKFDSVYILNNDGDYFKASLVCHDEVSDVAVLKVDKKNFKFSKTDLPYSISNTKAPIGARIFSLGFPVDDEVYNEGYVSSKNGFEGDKLQYTLTLPATYGQSGSPLLDASGNIIGILTAVGSQGEPNTYAVSTKAVVDLVEGNEELSKVHLHHNTRMANLSREKQIEKLEAFTFAVKVYKK